MGYNLHTISGYGHEIYGFFDENEDVYSVDNGEFDDISDAIIAHIKSLGLKVKSHRANEYHNETFYYIFGNISFYTNAYSKEALDEKERMASILTDENLTMDSQYGKIKLRIGQFDKHSTSFIG